VYYSRLTVNHGVSWAFVESLQTLDLWNSFILFCQGNTIISVIRPPTKIKQEREKRERERNRENRGLAQWF